MDRVTRWKQENHERDLAHKRAWRARQRARRQATRAAAVAATEQEETK